MCLYACEVGGGGAPDPRPVCGRNSLAFSNEQHCNIQEIRVYRPTAAEQRLVPIILGDTSAPGMAAKST